MACNSRKSRLRSRTLNLKKQSRERQQTPESYQARASGATHRGDLRRYNFSVPAECSAVKVIADQSTLGYDYQFEPFEKTRTVSQSGKSGRKRSRSATRCTRPPASSFPFSADRFGLGRLVFDQSCRPILQGIARQAGVGRRPTATRFSSKSLRPPLLFAFTKGRQHTDGPTISPILNSCRADHHRRQPDQFLALPASPTSPCTEGRKTRRTGKSG